MKRFLEGFVYATHGVLHTIAHQRNMKFHLISGFMVMLVGMALPLSLASRSALLFATFIVFFAEILNTALEAFVDLHSRTHEPQAMIAKDAAAAAVMVMAVCVLLVFGVILYNNWQVIVTMGGVVRRTIFFGLPASVALYGILVGPGNRLYQGALLVAGFSLLVPLGLKSQDPLFTFAAYLVFFSGWFARLRHPERD